MIDMNDLRRDTIRESDRRPDLFEFHSAIDLRLKFLDCVNDAHGKRFNEIQRETGLSDATISRLIKEGLADKVVGSIDHYTISKIGAELRNKLVAEKHIENSKDIITFDSEWMGPGSVFFTKRISNKDKEDLLRVIDNPGLFYKKKKKIDENAIVVAGGLPPEI